MKRTGKQVKYKSRRLQSVAAAASLLGYPGHDLVEEAIVHRFDKPDFIFIKQSFEVTSPNPDCYYKFHWDCPYFRSPENRTILSIADYLAACRRFHREDLIEELCMILGILERTS